MSGTSSSRSTRRAQASARRASPTRRSTSRSRRRWPTRCTRSSRPVRNFVALVKKYSQDPGSKQKGGEYTRRQGDVRQGVRGCQRSRSKTNQISKPVKSQFGYHLIQALAATKPGKTQTLAEAQKGIRARSCSRSSRPHCRSGPTALGTQYKGKVKYAAGFAPPADQHRRPPRSTVALDQALLDLQELTRRLRRDCPWDREQTARTIVPHTVEEAYEVADAAVVGIVREAPRRARRPALPGLLPRPAAGGARAGRPRGRRPRRTRQAGPAPPARLRRRGSSHRRAGAASAGRRSSPSKRGGKACSTTFQAPCRRCSRRARCSAARPRSGSTGPISTGPLAKLRRGARRARRGNRARRCPAAGDRAVARGVRRGRRPALHASSTSRDGSTSTPSSPFAQQRTRFVERVERAQQLAADEGQTWAELELDAQDAYYERAKAELRIS